MVINMINSKLHTISLPYPDKEDRRVWVYVPTHNEGDVLPVIYMLDGQNLFEELPYEFGCWDVVSAIEEEQKNGSTGVVIVGIDNGNIYRDSELTPKCIGEIQHRNLLNEQFTPEGEIFDDFMMNTVVPYIQKNFPVSTQRRYNAVCGSSSGGLQAFYAGVEHSEKFSFIGAFSPAFLIYTREDWQKYLFEKITDDVPYLYIYTGCGDELEQMIFDSVEMMYDLLPETGYPYHMMNEVILFEKEHNESAWKEIFKDFLHTFLNLEISI